jgi:hypothetical protein
MNAPNATESTTGAREHELQLLVIITRSLADLTSKLSDLTTLGNNKSICCGESSASRSAPDERH